MWLVLAAGCLAVNIVLGLLCFVLSNQSWYDRSALIGAATLWGIFWGVVAPPVLTLGRGGAVTDVGQAIGPLATYAVCAMALGVFVRLGGGFSVIPIFVCFRLARAWKSRGIK
jgi:hypothetical protein